MRPRECGHRCLAKCYQPCRCICKVDAPISAITAQPIAGDTRSRTSSDVRHARPDSALASGRGSPFGQLTPEEKAEQIDAFQAFSKGGHVQADKKLIEEINNQAVAALSGSVDLLGLDDDTSPKKKASGVELVRTTAQGRGVWKGTYNPQSSAADTEEERKEPMNLMD